MKPITYRADWVFTGHSEPIKDGIIEVAGDEVLSILPYGGHTVDFDLGPSLLIPGLVNRHVHLDLGGLRGKLPAQKLFTDWLKQVITYRRSSNPLEIRQAITEGMRESLRYGTIYLSDIVGDAANTDLYVNAVPDADLFLELIGLSEERTTLALEQAERWINCQHDRTLTCDLSPHAPYSVSRQLLCQLQASCRERPLAMHVAETLEELQLLSEHQGPLKEFLETLGAWHPENLVRSIDDLLELLAPCSEVYLVHGNYLRREQWQRFDENIKVVYCPRTHDYFGHDRHPYLEMLADHVQVALGTDSLASNPDLSILNECRFLWQRDRAHLTGPMLLNMATDYGTTHLFPGSSADFMVIPADGGSSDPWELLWGSSVIPSAVFLCGKKQDIL